MSVNELLAYRWLGNPIELWLLALTVIVAATMVLWALKQLAVKRLLSFAKRTATAFDDLLVDLLSRTRVSLIFLSTISPATAVLRLPVEVDNALRVVSVVALIVQLAIWGNAVIGFWLERYAHRAEDVSGAGATALSTMGVLARLLLGLLLILFLLDNLGVDVTALIAGLGLGGLLVALALQNVVADMLAALGILVGKPFVVGDVIDAQGATGTVEGVSVRSTRLRTLAGDELIVPNKKLLEGPIRNLTRMSERRVEFQIAVAYETPPEMLERIPAIAREVVQRHPLVRFDRSHFRAMRDWALEFDVIYFVASSDFTLYADIQQQINLELVRRFNEAGIEFARRLRTGD